MGNVISKKIAKDLSSRMYTSLSIQNSIHLADKKNAASLGLYDDEDQFFDPSENRIHLGIYGPLEIFKVETEEDYVAALEYFYGHENQHVRSTAKTPYGNGIRKAVNEIIEYIAAKEGIHKFFRNDKDYEVFVQTDLSAKGIHVNMNALISLCSNLMNSVEDGRIERIRSLEFPGFEKQRRYFRARFWNRDHEFKPYSLTMTDMDKLDIHCSAILSLATTGLYPKGFVAAYNNTSIMDEIQKIMPYIAKGVLAKRTRAMADNVVEIAKQLAPYIYAVCKYEPSEMEKAFEELLKRMLSQMISQMDMDKMSDTSEKEEEQDDGMPMPVFPMSNLVITLDDETYDKLMEKAKKDGNKGAGIMIRREHPKEEEQKENEDGDENGSGSGSSKNNEKESEQSKSGDSSGKGDPKDDSSNESNSSGSSADERDGSNSSSGGNGESLTNEGDSSSGSGKKGDESENKKESNSKANSNSSKFKKTKDSAKNKAGNQVGPSDKIYRRSEGGDSNNTKEGEGSHQSGGGENGSIEMVLEQMEQAAKECRDDIADKLTNINESISHTAKTNRGGAPVRQDQDKPITKEDVKDICKNGFEERKRVYNLDQHLPPVLNARAKAFRKKNERYFRSLSTPNVSHLDSGSIDPSLIYGLAFGETSVFRKIGTNKTFDGCVYVLLDNSGSMGGNKRTEACKAAAVIEDGFKGLIPMKIVAFDYSGGKVFHEVVKGWDESQKLNCCWNFALHGRSGLGNDDAKDILVAQRELLSRPEEKKLLIVLSDGAPADINMTRQAIDETRKKGINVYGIYFEQGHIGSDAEDFQYMYQKDYVCCELKDVDAELTKLMIKFSRS